MGLPFETPGGYDDLRTPDYDGYSHDPADGYQDPAEEDELFEDDYDVEEDPCDGNGQGDQAAWDPDNGPLGGPDQM
jgi:hypothetical protein